MTEGPYKLPEGWRWVKLGEVCEYQNGVWGNQDPKGYPVLRSKNFTDEGILTFEEVAYIKLTGQQVTKSKLHKGDILLERSGGGPNKPVGRVCIFTETPTDEIYCFGNFITVLRPSSVSLDAWYIFNYLRWAYISGMTEQLQTQTTNIRNLRFKEYMNLPIPLPPLEEQRRIVARIEELMERIREARHLRQKAREDTERLWQATLFDVFPRPGTALPPGWRWVKLGEVASKPQYGYSKSATSDPIGPKFVRITDISAGEIDWDKVPYCECDMGTFEKYRLYPGEVLFARSGSIGATILIKETPGDAMFASYLIRVKFREEVIPEFADLVLKAPVCQLQLVPQGAAQKNINAKLIERIFIPLPPLEEQRRIVVQLEEVEEKVKSLKEGQAQVEAELQRLEQSILNAAFRGEL